MTNSLAAGRSRQPLIRRRWPSMAVVSSVFIGGLLLWRIAGIQSPAVLPPAGVPIRVVRTIDGDTLLLEGGGRVRLLGVNTPETKHPDRPAEPYGEQAHHWTDMTVQHGPVILEYDRERLDQYRRVLAYVFLPDGTLLNERLIQQGLSPAIVTFPIRSDRSRQFLKAEQQAQTAGIGIWSLPQWQEKIKQQAAREQKRRAPRKNTPASAPAKTGK